MFILKISWRCKFLGKYLSKSCRHWLILLVATTSFQGGLNQVIFLFLVLPICWVLLSLYCSRSEYPEFFRASLYTGVSASKTSLLLDNWEILLVIIFESSFLMCGESLLIYVGCFLWFFWQLFSGHFFKKLL